MLSLLSLLLTAVSIVSNPIKESGVIRYSYHLNSVSDVNYVCGLIDLIGEFDTTNYLNEEEHINNAYDAYNLLSESDKSLIDQTRQDKLLTSYALYMEYLSTDTFNRLIVTLPAYTKVTFANHLTYAETIETIAYYYPYIDASRVSGNNQTKFNNILNRYNAYIEIDGIIEEIDNIGDITLDNYRDKEPIVSDLMSRCLSLTTASRRNVSNYTDLQYKSLLIETFDRYQDFIDLVNNLPDSDDYHREEHNQYTEDINNQTENRDYLREDEIALFPDIVEKYDEISKIDNDYVAIDVVSNNLHMSENNVGQCIDYYPEARDSYLNLTYEQQEVFRYEYVEEYMRLYAWADYHGEYIDDDDNDIYPYTYRSSMMKDDRSVSMVIIIMASISTLTMVALSLIIIKKKANKR